MNQERHSGAKVRRTTLAADVYVRGRGVHTGAAGTVRMSPAPFGDGVVFYLPDGTAIPATTEFATATPGSTALHRHGRTVHTPEHLLAALTGIGITDVRIELDGPEVPILDGSAAVWCEEIGRAGRQRGPAADRAVVTRPFTMTLAGGTATLAPGPNFDVDVQVDYDTPNGPSGRAAINVLSDDFVHDVAPARTFVLAQDIERLRTDGRGAGATPINTVVWGTTPSPPLRFSDEPVRHKLLDAIGDLALLGAPLQGRLSVHRGSHQLHLGILRQALAIDAIRVRRAAPL